MTVERNVEGLRGNAQRKRQETFDKVEQGIQQLIKEKRAINFNTVARASGVSKAWLYKEPEIKTRIEHLRQNHSQSQKVPPKQKTSDASKDAIIKTLKARIQKVEAENRGLREHLETIHGRQRALVDENETLRRENEQLTKMLASAKAEIEIIKNDSDKSSSASNLSISKRNKVTSPPGEKPANSKIDSAIKSELDTLGVKINPTLQKVLKSASSEVALQAIATLKEALSKTEVPNKEGFLVAAINNSWIPNEDYKKKQELVNFNVWFTLAQSLGLVRYSMLEDDVQYVITAQEEWIPFSEMIDQYPLEKLQAMTKK